MSGLAWPDTAGTTWPDWIEAIGTAGAFLLAALLLARELRQRRTADARRVSAWAIEVHPCRPENEVGLAMGNLDGKSVKLRAYNAGETPVYDFVAHVHGRIAQGPILMSGFSQVLPPGQSELWVDMVELEGWPVDRGLPPVDVTFMDVKQRRWQRLHNGQFGRDRTSREGRTRSLRSRISWWWRVRQLKREERKVQMEQAAGDAGGGHTGATKQG